MIIKALRIQNPQDFLILNSQIANNKSNKTSWKIKDLNYFQPNLINKNNIVIIIIEN